MYESALVQTRTGAPGWNRTSDTRFRKPVLYPLSYEGMMPICRSFSCRAVPGKDTRVARDLLRVHGRALGDPYAAPAAGP